MGIERTTIAAKISPENRAWIGVLLLQFAPLRVTTSSLIDMLLMYLRVRSCAGEIDLSLRAFQGLDRYDRKPSLPLTVGPHRIDPLQTVLAFVNQKMGAAA